MILADTNVYLRAFIGDVEAQAKQARALFRDAAKGRVRIYLSAAIVAEVAWIGTNRYGLARVDVLESFALLQDAGVFGNPQAPTVIEALRLYAGSKIDFPDCWLVALGQSERLDLATFDSDFDAFPRAARYDWDAGASAS